MACALPKEVSVQVLDFLPDTSVLELAVASPSFNNTLPQGRMSGGGPWHYPEGTWQPAGLWRLLSLGCLRAELRRIPTVTLCCKIYFKDTSEVLEFLQGAKALAKDTVDGRVLFSIYSFNPRFTARFFSGGNMGDACEAWPYSRFFFNGIELTCHLEVRCFEDFEQDPIFGTVLEDVPSLYLDTAGWDLGHPCLQGLGLCGRPLASPTVKLMVSKDHIYEVHQLDATSPLISVVCKGEELPHFFGVTRLPEDPE